MLPRSPSRLRGPLRVVGLLAVLTAPLAAPVLPAASAHPSSARLVESPRDLGFDRLGVRRGDRWLLRDALDAGPARGARQGASGWLPFAGDLDGDGAASLGLFRDGTWQLRDAETGPVRTVRFGVRGDVPVVGDWNGDGVDTIGVFRAGRWFLRAGNGVQAPAARAFAFGLPSDVPVVGDWNGDGTDDVAVRRGATWYQRDAPEGGPAIRTFRFGNPGDLPVAGDWDHDGKDTPGVFRGGTWYLRRGSFPSPYQTVAFGRPGDLPVVRRTPGLAPGVQHRVVQDPAAPWVAHVATVALAAASSPETVLSQDRLQGVEPLSTLTRRAGAVLGINGDFFLASGRPVHLYANDGRLVQWPTILGRAFSLDATGTRFSMGYPDVRVRLTARPGEPTARTAELTRFNGGPRDVAGVHAYTAAGALLESPPDGQCYAGLLPTAPGVVRRDGTVDTRWRSGGARCGGAPAAVPAGGTLLVAGPAHAGGSFIRTLPAGTPVRQSAQLGFPGAVDALGGNPLLVVGGAVVAGEVEGRGAFFGRHGRTAVGTTADGRLLLVVVDGRQPGYSRGMTLRELADLMQRLGAQEAVNLDGGGSSQMVVNGLVATRPSDGSERGISNALVVLPGRDEGQAELGIDAAAAGDATRLSRSLRGPGASDGGSTGGLADALVREGTPVTAELRRTADAFRRSPAR